MMKSNWKSNFFVLWSGQAFSMVTSAMLQMAVVYYITEQNGTAYDLSLALMVGFLPYALLGPFIGVFVDRYDRKKIMIGSDLMIAGASLIIPISGLFAEVSMPLILGVLLLRSIGQAFYAPALSAITPLIVPQDKLTQYAGYSQSLESISYIVSPALAILAYQHGGLNTVILFDVCGALVASLAVILAYIPKLNVKNDTLSQSVMKEFKEGVQTLLDHKDLLTLTIFGCLYVLIFMPISALFPLMSTQHFMGGKSEITLVEVVFAVGMLMGGLGLSRIGTSKKRSVFLSGSIVVCGITLFISGILPHNGYGIFVALCLLMGMSMPFYYGIQGVFFQEKLQPEVLGRVFSLVGAITTLVTPLGLGISALFADSIGIGQWFALSGVGILMIGVLMFLSKAIKSLDAKTQS